MGDTLTARPAELLFAAADDLETALEFFAPFPEFRPLIRSRRFAELERARARP